MTEAAAPATEQPDTVESDAEFFAKAGPLPTAWDEARRHPRFHYRSRVQATVHPFHGAPQAPVECALLTRDLSRGGINLLHTQQLYPGQRIELAMLDGKPRTVEVCWCRRMAARSYSVGCRFLAAPAGDATPRDTNA